MPELPEVESTARFLHDRVAGATISAVQVLWDRTVARPSKREFCRTLPGSTIDQVTRSGKFVVFRLSRPGAKWYLFGHMRMSGSFDVLGSINEREKHDRIVISLEGGQDIRFHDPRKFGRFVLTQKPEEVEGRIGVEPLSDLFTPARLEELLKSRAGAVKPTLLNQTLIAGLGNIYVDEALWGSKIHPLRRCNRIKTAEFELLHSQIQTILRDAIVAAGTDFGDGVVYGGGYQPKVYGRDGEDCHRCGEKIRRIVVGQRGTHFCPKCQPRPRK